MAAIICMCSIGRRAKKQSHIICATPPLYGVLVAPAPAPHDVEAVVVSDGGGVLPRLLHVGHPPPGVPGRVIAGHTGQAAAHGVVHPGKYNTSKYLLSFS